jgi:WD40 repeat protein
MVASAACVLPVADDDEDEFGMGPGQVFSTAFHPDMSMVAASYQDGSVRVYDLDVDPCKDGPDIAPMLHCIDPGTKLPTMAVRFRPEKSKSRNVLVSVDSSGSVQHWHLSSGKCLHEIVEDATHPLTQRQYRNQIFALQYSRDGEMFATAGKDKSIRIYEEATKSHVATLSQNIMGTSRGHSNCIFSVKWHPTDPNVLLSAGWDNTVCIWDKRAKTGAVRSIFGPHVAGDSLGTNARHTKPRPTSARSSLPPFLPSHTK